MSSQILCPSCRSEAVAVPPFTFAETSVEVTVCGKCQETGLVSVKVRKSGLLDLEVPTYGLRHRDGLAVFTASSDPEPHH